MVTARGKSISRLEAKCRQREGRRGGYSSIEEIVDDIVDLAGVRVALYFPAERDQVDGLITRLFKQVSPRKDFPASSEPIRHGKRFSGYSASHYRVQLKEEELSDSEKRYATARIEVQVASVLMHAWAEVEHDLVYKPLAGDLSEEEYAILDQLNGLVIAGEIGLETLQKAGEAAWAAAEVSLAVIMIWQFTCLVTRQTLAISQSVSRDSAESTCFTT
jgi:ppGpp synthetase/RelA/SpoT-type nucleotidyltranferase